MNKKLTLVDREVLKIADKYVSELRKSERLELWRDYWKLEGEILARKKAS